MAPVVAVSLVQPESLSPLFSSSGMVGSSRLQGALWPGIPLPDLRITLPGGRL